jgi:cell division protein FtsL
MTSRLLNLLLIVALLASALVLVKTSHEARRAFAQLDRAKAEQRRLDVEYKRLDAERQAQATNLRVEKVAREKLRMGAPGPGLVEYVDDPQTQAAARGATPPAKLPDAGAVHLARSAAR